MTGTRQSFPPYASVDHFDGDPEWLRNELLEAHATIHQLLRQIEHEQERYAEIARSYKLTVDNLVEVTRQSLNANAMPTVPAPMQHLSFN